MFIFKANRSFKNLDLSCIINSRKISQRRQALLRMKSIIHLSDRHRKTLTLFAYGLFGTTLPFIVTAILSTGYGKWPGMSYFYQSGDFYIYSAAFSAQALYFLNTNDNQKKGNGKFLSFFALSILIVSSFIYSSLVTTKLNSSLITLTSGFLSLSSVLLLLFSLILFYSSGYYNEEYTPDLRKQEIADVERLKNKI